jgi:hypothetical protein
VLFDEVDEKLISGAFSWILEVKIFERFSGLYANNFFLLRGLPSLYEIFLKFLN